MSKHKWANQSAKAKSLPLSAIKKIPTTPRRKTQGNSGKDA